VIISSSLDGGDQLRASLEREWFGLDDLANCQDVVLWHTRAEIDGAPVHARHAPRDDLNSDRTHVLSVSQAGAEQDAG